MISPILCLPSSFPLTLSLTLASLSDLSCCCTISLLRHLLSPSLGSSLLAQSPCLASLSLSIITIAASHHETSQGLGLFDLISSNRRSTGSKSHNMKIKFQNYTSHPFTFVQLIILTLYTKSLTIQVYNLSLQPLSTIMMQQVPPSTYFFKYSPMLTYY